MRWCGIKYQISTTAYIKKQTHYSNVQLMGSLISICIIIDVYNMYRMTRNRCSLELQIINNLF